MAEYVKTSAKCGQETGLSVVGGCIPQESQSLQNVPSDDEYDPDHDDVSDILQRLGDYSPLLSDPLIYISCDCLSVRNSTTTDINFHGYDDSSDTEVEEIVLDSILSMLRKFQHMNPTKLSNRALTRLIKGFRCQEQITKQQCDELWSFLRNDNHHFQEFAILLIQQICLKSENVAILLEQGALQFVESVILSGVWNSLYTPIINLLERLMSAQVFIDDVQSLEFCVSNIIPLLQEHLKINLPLDYKYSICCCFRTLARYDCFCPLLLESVLPVVSYLQNTTAKLKEVYTEILTEVVSYSEEVNPQLINSSVIPCMGAMVREGPCGAQMKAIHLLAVVTGLSSACIASVIGDKLLLCHALWCLKSSKCRSVRKSVVELMCNLTRCRKLGMCKDFMVEMAQTLLSDGRLGPHAQILPSNGSQQISYPARFNTRFGMEIQIWNGLDEFTEILVELLNREARTEEDETGKFVKLGISSTTDLSSQQLQSIQKLVETLENVCLWPLDRLKCRATTKTDLAYFTDSEKQRITLSKINRGLIPQIWQKTGQVVLSLINIYAQKIKHYSDIYQDMKKNDILNSSISDGLHSVSDSFLLKNHRDKEYFSALRMDRENLEKKFTKNGSVKFEEVFEHCEFELLSCLLNFVLCISLCGCGEFTDISAKKKTRNNRIINSSNNTGRDGNHNENNAHSSGHLFPSQHCKMATSNVKVQGHSPGQGKSGKSDLVKKEENIDQRKLRKSLYEAGVFSSVCPFMMVNNDIIQILCLQILRCCIQPVSESLGSQISTGCIHTTVSSRSKIRPMSAACTAKEREQQLNVALHKMSPDLAGLIKKAIGSRPPSVSTTPQLQSIKELDSVENSRCRSVAGKDRSRQSVEKALIDNSRPVAAQCRQRLIQEGGNILLKTLFTASQDVRKQCVLLLHDLVQFGEVSIHMELTSRGCISKLLDFLRVNDEHELLEIIGLIIVRIMVSSDDRIKELFEKQGGPSLLISMANYTTGIIRQEVSATLKSVTKDIPKRGARPKSAPVHSSSCPDVWDQIACRWKKEDRVTKILRQWMK